MQIDTVNLAHTCCPPAAARLERRAPRRRARGFTLVEIMVAVTIGLIILVAVAQLFATSRATYSLEEGLARVQENGRFAMEFLARDLRMAGYAGCLNVNQDLNANANFSATNGLVNTSSVVEYSFGPRTHIVGYEWTGTGTGNSQWNPTLPNFLSGASIAPQSDVLVIQRGAEQSYRLASAMPTAGATIFIPSTTDIGTGDIILVADCSNVDVVQVTAENVSGGIKALEHDAAPGTPGNTAADLAKNYDNSAEVMKLVTRAYYVGWRKNDDTNPRALFRAELLNGTMQAGNEMVEGIDSIQIEYGEDTFLNGSADVYRLPGAVTEPGTVQDWSRVVSVRLGLVVGTPDETGPETDTRVWNVLSRGGTDQTDDFGPADDRRQRRIFSTTVQLRNLRTN